MCEHLLPLENEIKQMGFVETYRGPTWTKNCREWVYFDCYFDIEKIRKRLNLPDFITHHVNNDNKSGLEEGFYCELCKDAIMGLHSKFRMNDDKKTVE